MVDLARYAKTEKGIEEISARRNNLRGKLRTMLILTDPSKSGQQLRQQGALIGVPEDFLETLLADGYIAPATAIGAARVNGHAHAGANGHAVNGANGHSASGLDAQGGVIEVTAPVTIDELARFREAKSFMNETVVSALGIRAFMFTLRLERCSTREDLGQLLPDYERSVRKGTSEPEARAMADRLRELLA